MVRLLLFCFVLLIAVTVYSLLFPTHGPLSTLIKCIEKAPAQVDAGVMCREPIEHSCEPADCSVQDQQVIEAEVKIRD